MTFPKISIITPSLNQGAYIGDTIQSVLGQNYPNLEYIIIDGGSTDGTVNIIKKYSDKITYWISEKDNGQANAINKGFKISTGDILLWLNSDDLLMPNTLNYLASAYLKYGDMIYIGNCLHFKESPGGQLDAWGSHVTKCVKDYSLEIIDYIIQPASFWTRGVWQKVGYLNESLHYAFDWEWFLRAKKANIKLLPLNKCLALYRYHNEHKSSTGGSKRQREISEIYDSYSPKHGKLYRLLIEYSNKERSFSNKLYERILSYRSKSFGQRIKRTYPLLYQEFSAKEIDQVSKML